ncbi:MAG: leucine-rich repeat domain-containing protein [Cyclobacteriaceae bacterium]
MKRNKLWVVAVSLVFFLAFEADAQKSKTQKPAKKTTVQKPKSTKPATQKPKTDKPAGQQPKTGKPSDTKVDASQDEQKVKDLIAFLQFVLNTLGSSATSARDKDVLITESYAKIFSDAKVQVEDDLDEERKVINNKDVVAYLKDVDFFFKDVKFEFIIEDIQGGVNANGKTFYKVSLNRNLSGTTADGKPINNTIPRYIEINYNPESQDLKVASIYTNEFDQKEALTNWWRQLSFEWQTIFKRKLNLIDSVNINDIKNITSIDELDLSHNTYIQTIEPLSQLINLKLLNLSYTNVKDLTPIRNLTELVELNLAKTKVFDLTPLKYSVKMQRLNISDTEIRSIAVIEKMVLLQNLEMEAAHVIDFLPVSTLRKILNLNLKGTLISDLSPISKLDQLMELNLSGTPVRDVKPIKDLKSIKVLYLDSTRINDINALTGFENLEVLHANYTLVGDLSPLQKLKKLERIYCDQSPVKKSMADAFMKANSNVLVIFDSKDLQAWWATLSTEWQGVLSNTAKIGSTPAKEELAKVTNLDSMNLSGHDSIKDLEPLRKLQKLQVIIANNTAVDNLSPLQDHREITYLDVSDTEVIDFSVAAKFTHLKVLRADRTKIEKLDPFFNLKGLKELYVDRTNIHDITAQEFLEKNTGSLIVYKTIHLDRWWKGLSPGWKAVFRTQMLKDTTSTRENLHRLVELEKLELKDARVRELTALSEFIRLKELHFSATGISEIPPLENLKTLQSLHATNSPLQRIGAISLLRELQDLDIANTPVDELKGLESLKNLKHLNCAGTQIKRLDPLENLETLETLDCSNTNVSKLEPVSYLSLKTLTSYNTKITSREMEKFKENNPECNIVYYR